MSLIGYPNCILTLAAAPAAEEGSAAPSADAPAADAPAADAPAADTAAADAPADGKHKPSHRQQHYYSTATSAIHHAFLQL